MTQKNDLFQETNFKKSLVFVGTIGVASAVFSCGPELTDLSGATESKNGTLEKIIREEKVKISARVVERPSFKMTDPLLLLADATTFTIVLEGCASGDTGTATQASPTLNVTKYDKNCLAKLTQFQFNGVTFIPDVPFTTWQEGDSAIFKDSMDESQKVKVVVTGQLASSVEGTEAISYTFSQISAGSDTTFGPDQVSAPHPISISGVGSPAFTVKIASYVGMTSQGGGQFEFKLECQTNLTGTGTNLACQDNLLSAIKYRLVKDDFGGTLDINQAATLFGPGSGALNVDLASEVIPVNDPSLPKGGFTTPVAADPDVLTGPNQMHLNPHMLLVIEAAGTSYTYFNVDVSPINN